MRPIHQIKQHLGAGVAITQDGEMITVNTDTKDVFLEAAPGQGVASPRQKAWHPLPEEHKKKGVGDIQSLLFLGGYCHHSITYELVYSADNECEVYSGDPTAITFLQKNTVWFSPSTVDITAEKKTDSYLYVFAYNVTGSPTANPSGFIARVNKRINGDITASVYSTTTTWDVVLTTTDIRTATEADKLALVAAGGWTTPPDTYQNGSAPSWGYFAAYSTNAYWIWGETMEPVGSTPYEINLFRFDLSQI